MIIRGHEDVLHVANQSDECGSINFHWDDITFAKAFVFVCWTIERCILSSTCVACQHGTVLKETCIWAASVQHAT